LKIIYDKYLNHYKLHFNHEKCYSEHFCWVQNIDPKLSVNDLCVTAGEKESPPVALDLHALGAHSVNSAVINIGKTSPKRKQL